jgi:hypothetical protein
MLRLEANPKGCKEKFFSCLICYWTKRTLKKIKKLKIKKKIINKKKKERT